MSCLFLTVAAPVVLLVMLVISGGCRGFIFEFTSPSHLLGGCHRRCNSLPFGHCQARTDDGIPPVLTSALLQISYDGSHFSGWSAANNQSASSSSSSSIYKTDAPVSSRRRPNQGLYTLQHLQGRPRSVQDVLRSNLAKLFGNIDPQLIQAEGCSRTDKGVHAKGMVVWVFCLQERDTTNPEENEDKIPEINHPPRPKNATDSTFFRPLPMGLERLAFALNRMLPPDVRVMKAAPMPIAAYDKNSSSSACSTLVFHPTLSSIWKTYEYRIWTGPRCDPLRRRWGWHIEKTKSSDVLNMIAMQTAAKMLQGQHDFAAFRGSPRGSSDKIKFQHQETVCRVIDVHIAVSPLGWRGNDEANEVLISITANRFLYKMVRFMVGTLVAVGTEAVQLSHLQHMLDTGERLPNVCISCAPTRGLTLDRVEYDPAFVIDWQPVNS